MMNTCLIKDWTVAATFAEAGEWETAMMYIPENIMPAKNKITWFDRVMAAISFAEEGLHDDALMIFKKRPIVPVIDDLMEELGLKGSCYTFGVVRIDSI